MASIAISLGIAAAGMAVQYFTQKRVKTAPTDRGRYDDIRIQGSDYGAFIPFVKGKMRLAPQIIWSNGIQHYVRTSGGGSGGKGGNGTPSQGTVNEHIYQTSVALLVCANEIEEFKRIWADADSLYSTGTPNEVLIEAEDADLSGTAHSVNDVAASDGKYVTGVGGTGTVLFDFDSADLSLPDDPPPDPDIEIPYTSVTIYYKCSANKTAILSFDGGAGASVTFPNSDGVFAAFQFDLIGHKHTLEISGAAVTADIDAVSVLYYYDNPNQYRNPQVTGIVNPLISYPTDLNDPSAYYNYIPPKDAATGESNAQTTIPTQSIRFYTGTETQTQDSAIVAWLDARYGAGEGVKRCSAMRGLSYVLIENYTIPNGRLPNFTIEVYEGSEDVADYVTFLYEAEGIGAENLELEALEDLELGGFIINQFTPAAQTIKQLEVWFSFRMVEIDGKFRAVLEYDSIVGTIPAADLRAHDYGSEMPEADCEIVSRDEQSAPLVSIVNFMNEGDLEYHNEPAEDRLCGSTSAREIKEQNFPFVSEPDVARQVATKELLKDHLELKSFPFDTMPKYARYAPGDRITLELPTRSYDVRILKKQMALTGRVHFEAVPSDVEIYQNSAVKGTKAPPTSLLSKSQAQPNFPRNSKLLLIESVPMVTEHRGELGLYMAVCGRGKGNWNGAEIRKETGGIYEVISSVNAPSPIGVAQETLGDWVTETELDETNTLTVVFFDDVEFESVDGTDAYNNPSLNLIRVGDEWLQFTTATAETLPDNSIYRSAWTFTDFWRGRFGTVGAIPSHGGDEFVCAVTDALKWRRFEPAEIGETLNFKAVTNGQSVELAPTESISLQAISLQPLVFPEGYTITKFDSYLRFSNRGASSQANFGLPLGIEGFVCSFVVEDEDGLAIQPTNPDTILFGGHVATFGEYLYSTTVGSFLTLRYTDETWIAEDITGVWNINE